MLVRPLLMLRASPQSILPVIVGLRCECVKASSNQLWYPPTNTEENSLDFPKPGIYFADRTDCLRIASCFVNQTARISLHHADGWSIMAGQYTV